jgi:selenocysteine-specific elongation factor
MTVVVGTAGHIDHGKTALLRALTGIDADRLPEERRRGMTIDVGYAWLTLPDGGELDFVDVPGHDRLVGNMLVGAGEVDAALLVIAADEGPRPQTLEHLGLLDALRIEHGVVAITKVDLIDQARLADVAAQAAALVTPTSLSGAPVVAVSSATGEGVERLAAALVGLRDRVEASRAAGDATAGSRLAIDRVFSVRGRGTVVTGTLRGAPVVRGESLRLVPGEREVRVKAVQVHGREVEAAGRGRAAFNLGGIEFADLARGQALVTGDAVSASDRLLVALDRASADRTRARLHTATTQVDVVVGRSGRDGLELPDGRPVATLRLGARIAAAAGDRFVLRRSSGSLVSGGVVLDPGPPRGVSRRRQTSERVATLVAGGDDARLELHGAIGTRLARDVARDLDQQALDALREDPNAADLPLARVRSLLVRRLRRLATVGVDDARRSVDDRLKDLAQRGVIVRDGDRVRLPGAAAGPPDPALAAAMDRLQATLAVSAPPSLVEASRAAGCPPEGVRALQREGRIIVIGDDLAYAADTYASLTRRALDIARVAPLTPAGFRDGTGTSRKYALAILEDLDRRGFLRRTPAGHVPGPRAPIEPGGRRPGP